MRSEHSPVTEAIILAGGLGTRLRAVLPDLPKPMALVAGKPFLAHQFDYLVAQGIQQVVLSVGYLQEVIRQYFGNCYGGVKITYAAEEFPMGTGGGLLLALQQCAGDKSVLVLNGDTWFPVSVAEMVTFHLEKLADVTIALHKQKSEGRYGGIVVESSQRVVNFLLSGEGESHYINGGVYLVSPACRADWLEQIGSKLSLERDLLEKGIACKLACYGFLSEAEFIDIGVPDDYALAARVIKQ